MAAAIFAFATAAAAQGGDHFDRMVHDKLQTMLKDPYSAVVELSRSLRATAFKTQNGVLVSGWAACYRVNAKNAFGGYTGAHQYLFVTDGKTITLAIGEEANRRDAVDVVKECRHAASAPPTEGATAEEAAAAPAGPPPFAAEPSVSSIADDLQPL